MEEVVKIKAVAVPDRRWRLRDRPTRSDSEESEGRMRMALYIVVHHPENPHRNWSNEWDDEGLLRTITTPKDVANRCESERKQGHRIFVHRCAWGGVVSTIHCSVQVSKIAFIDRATALLTFMEAKRVKADPPLVPHQGQNSYYAKPPPGHE